MVDLLFDATEEQNKQIGQMVQSKFEEANFEKIDVLPQWVKSFLLR